MKRQNKVAFFNFLSVVLLKGIAIFTAPVFSRMLGTGGYGVVSIYTIWVSAVTIVFTLQVQGTLPTARVEYPEGRQDAYHSSALTLGSLSFLLCALVVMIFRKPIADLLHLHPILIPMILIQSFFGFCVQFANQKFVYEYRADLNCLISVSVAVLTLGFSVVLILLMPEGKGYYGRIFGMVLTYVIVGGISFFYILRKGKTGYHREFWRFCLPLAVPFVFYNLSDLILGQSDRVMLQQMLSEEQVGTYSLALNFGNIMFTIFGALNTTWCPFFFDDMKEGKKDHVQSQAGNFLEIFTILSMGFVLLHREVYHIFARRDFWSGTACIPVFVLGYYLNFLCTFPVNFEYYHKKTKAIAVVTIFASAVNIGLNYLWIRKYGMLGAAAATTVSHGLQLLCHDFYARYILKRGDYPFRAGKELMWLGLFAGALLLTVKTPDLWPLRWVLGAALGLFELVQIKKRRAIF